MKNSERKISCTILEPDEEALADFEGWQEEQKAALEARGFTITEVDGFNFYGYIDPQTPASQS